jgi:hypothetical protein
MITRTIERNEEKSLDILLNLSKSFYLGKKLTPLLIRPYLLKQMDKSLIEKAKFHGFVDIEYDHKDTVNNFDRVGYAHVGPFISYEYDQYFGYRQAWHMLYYAPKNLAKEVSPDGRKAKMGSRKSWRLCNYSYHTLLSLY